MRYLGQAPHGEGGTERSEEARRTPEAEELEKAVELDVEQSPAPSPRSAGAPTGKSEERSRACSEQGCREVAARDRGPDVHWVPLAVQDIEAPARMQVSRGRRSWPSPREGGPSRVPHMRLRNHYTAIAPIRWRQGDEVTLACRSRTPAALFGILAPFVHSAQSSLAVSVDRAGIGARPSRGKALQSMRARLTIEEGALLGGRVPLSCCGAYGYEA